MKYIIYLVMPLVYTAAFSQKLDSLVFTYYIGHECTKNFDTIAFRGICDTEEKIYYKEKRKSYLINDFIRMEKFRVREAVLESGEDNITHKKQTTIQVNMGPNMIKDSVKCVAVSSNHKIPIKAQDKLLRSIINVQYDTCLPYTIDDIPESFLKRNNLKRKSLDATQLDSLLRDKLNSIAISTGSVSYLTISFQLEGKYYRIWKNPNNIYWFFRPEERESEYPLHIICFELDAFLSDHLPQHFSGVEVLN